MNREEMKRKRIGVLLGGLSKEREISLKSGRGVLNALKEASYENVVEIDVGFDLAQKLKDNKIEVVFIVLHGRYGEDGAVQGLLEFLRIPYTGSSVLGCALSMNKAVSKKIFAEEGITTAEFLVFDKEENLKNIIEKIDKSSLGYPIVIKPACEGSTIGLSVVEDKNGLMEGLKIGFDHDPEIVVERFIKGTEVTVGILDGKPLPLVEIAPKEGIFDYKSKYTKGMTEYFVPARVSKEISEKSQDLGIRAFRSLKCAGFGRVDLIVDSKGEPYVLEVNSIPGMTGTSLLPMAAKEIGLGYKDLVEKILLSASLKIGD